MSVWAGVGFTMLIFCSRSEGIPTNLEAAVAGDGATARQLIWYIELPLLQRVITFVFVTGIIGGFQVFQQVYPDDAWRPRFNAGDCAVVNTAFQVYALDWRLLPRYDSDSSCWVF